MQSKNPLFRWCSNLTGKGAYCSWTGRIHRVGWEFTSDGKLRPTPQRLWKVCWLSLKFLNGAIFLVVSLNGWLVTCLSFQWADVRDLLFWVLFILSFVSFTTTPTSCGKALEGNLPFGMQFLLCFGEIFGPQQFMQLMQAIGAVGSQLESSTRSRWESWADTLSAGVLVILSSAIRGVLNLPISSKVMIRLIKVLCARKKVSRPVFKNLPTQSMPILEARAALYAVKHIARSVGNFGCKHLLLLTVWRQFRGLARVVHKLGVSVVWFNISAVALCSRVSVHVRWVPSEWNSAGSPCRGGFCASTPQKVFSEHGAASNDSGQDHDFNRSSVVKPARAMKSSTLKTNAKQRTDRKSDVGRGSHWRLIKNIGGIAANGAKFRVSSCQQWRWSIKHWPFTWMVDIVFGASYDLRSKRNQRKILGWIRSGLVKAVHLGTPCNSFSRARDRRPGPPPLRSDQQPLGLNNLREADRIKVIEGNLFMRFSCQVCRLCITLNIPFTLENPSTSRLWLCPPVEALMRRKGVSWADVDFCAFKKRWRKRTRFLYFGVDLSHMASYKCVWAKRGCCAFSGWPHIPLMGLSPDGQFMTKIAEPFSLLFCRKISQAFFWIGIQVW